MPYAFRGTTSWIRSIPNELGLQVDPHRLRAGCCPARDPATLATVSLRWLGLVCGAAVLLAGCEKAAIRKACA